MKELKSWHEKYLKKEIINIRENLDSNDLEILCKLGINIEDKLYTGYEFDIIEGELLKYYLSDDMDEDEKKETVPLDGTGVSREEYNWVLKKFEQMQENIQYDN